MTKYVFVTGGVVSSIGKGLAAASIGALMEARGLRVTHIKLDPYINVDPGTMSPYHSMVRFTSPTTVPRPISISVTTSASQSARLPSERLHDGPHLDVGDQQGAAW